MWPHSLKRGAAATRLLELRVRIPLGSWISVSCECCVCCQVEVCCGGLINCPEGVLPSVMVVTEYIPKTSKLSKSRVTKSVDP